MYAHAYTASLYTCIWRFLHTYTHTCTHMYVSIPKHVLCTIRPYGFVSYHTHVYTYVHTHIFKDECPPVYPHIFACVSSHVSSHMSTACLHTGAYTDQCTCLPISLLHLARPSTRLLIITTCSPSVYCFSSSPASSTSSPRSSACETLHAPTRARGHGRTRARAHGLNSWLLGATQAVCALVLRAGVAACAVHPCQRRICHGRLRPRRAYTVHPIHRVIGLSPFALRHPRIHALTC